MTTRWWRAVFVMVELALLLAVPVLAYKGFDAVLDTTAGRAVDPELDPEEPGYEAFVEPSPVLGVLGRDADGALSWVTVLALTGAGQPGGGVLLVPAGTVVPAFALPEDWQTLAEIDAAGGTVATVQAVEDVMGAAVGDVVELGPDRLAQLLGPVSPLAVENPDDVGRFEAGTLELAADDADDYLAALATGESDLTRLVRHEAFWRGWLAAVAASGDPNVVPGETETGLGRFVRGLAGGAVVYGVPPVTPRAAEADGAATGGERFDLDWPASIDLGETIIPFPASPRPGARPLVRVLDGAGATGLAARTAVDVVAAGGQVVVVGNADRFDAVTTRVVYFEPAVAGQAEQIAAAFGVVAEQLSGPNPDDRVDVTVVAGTDRLAAYGLTARSTTIGDDAG